MDTREIDWGSGTVTGVREGSGDIGILLAHGAGTDQHHPSIALLRAALGQGGLNVMSFNYPYTERGAKGPDAQPKLLACHKAAADAFAQEVDHLYLAGRSMGGRMGTYLAAEGYPATGLILYAYPLHPAGKPEKLRIDQFSDIDVPMLFLQGTRDALSRMELFEQHIAPLPRATIELLDGLGHGTRGGGWDVESVTERYASVSLSWIETVSSGKTKE